MDDEFKYKHRAGTAAQWADPQDGPLLRGEIGVLLDGSGTPLGAKIGDGETAFADLPELGGNGTSLQVLKIVSHQPGSTASYASGGVMTAADTTNLRATFTIPSSGKVLVRLSAWGKIVGASNYARWALMEGAATVTNSNVQVAGADNVLARHSATMVLTGLTPGASVTWDWAHRASNGAAGNSFIYADSSTIGPAVMEFYGLPE